MKNIIEIQITNQRVSKFCQWEILVGLYKEVLHKDPNWHFFYEIFFNIIRCSRRFKRRVLKYLDSQSVKYEVKGPWVDNQEITFRYQKQFKDIFHANSEMIMSMALNPKMDSKSLYTEIYLIADRLAHCFILNCDYIAKPWKDAARQSASWEVYLMSMLAHHRGLYIGENGKRVEESNCSWDGYESDYTWAYSEQSKREKEKV